MFSESPVKRPKPSFVCEIENMRQFAEYFLDVIKALKGNKTALTSLDDQSYLKTLHI